MKKLAIISLLLMSTLTIAGCGESKNTGIVPIQAGDITSNVEQTVKEEEEIETNIKEDEVQTDIDEEAFKEAEERSTIKTEIRVQGTWRPADESNDTYIFYNGNVLEIVSHDAEAESIYGTYDSDWETYLTLCYVEEEFTNEAAVLASQGTEFEVEPEYKYNDKEIKYTIKQITLDNGMSTMILSLSGKDYTYTLSDSDKTSGFENYGTDTQNELSQEEVEKLLIEMGIDPETGEPLE